MKTISLQVEGMTCIHCKRAVENAIHETGAKGLVSLEEKKAEVTFDELSTSLEKIKHAIEEEGYQVVG